MRVRNPHPRLVLVSTGFAWITIAPGQEATLPEGVGALEVERGDLIEVEASEEAPEVLEEEAQEAPKEEPAKEPPKKASKAKGKTKSK